VNIAMRYFYVNPSQMAGANAVIEGSEASHLKNVMRLKLGDEVGLVDGTGYEYAAQIDRILPGRVELSITSRQRSSGIAPLRIHVAQGVLKEKKMDRIVRQIAELGAARWSPFICARTVARPQPRGAAYRKERWRKIAIEALKQCRRGDLMEVDDLTRFENVLAQGRSHDFRILFWEGARETLMPHGSSPPAAGSSSALLVLGPEGGFSKEEAGVAQEAGFRIASLGPRILRAETAAVAAVAIVQYLFGDLGPGQKNLDKK